jgi:hypothetical protein
MRTGKGWRLARKVDDPRPFKAALILTFKAGGERIAVFRVLP